MEEKPKNKGGRPRKDATAKKELKDEIASILEKNVKVIKDALQSGQLQPKEAAQLYKDLLPYGASKKTDEKNMIPEHLKFVKIIVKGYKPNDNPYADTEPESEDDNE